MSPFDEARYARLLKGLEVAEVRLSQLEFSGRLDSEYYRPSHIGAEQLILARGGVALSSLCDFIIGPFGSAFSVEHYTNDRTYRYIRGKDVKPMSLAEGDNVFMPKADFERLSKYSLQVGDVLTSVVGTLGNSALVEQQHLPAIFSCKSTAIRTRKIRPRYLVTYLNCKYGRSLLVRKERGAVQKGLNLEDLRTLSVYVAGESLQKGIEDIHLDAGLAREKSKDQLQNAEAHLLDALDLGVWRPPDAGIFVRNSRDVFTAKRLDAEHFQPRFKALADHIEAAGCCENLGDWLTECQRGSQPIYSDIGLLVVNSKHVLRGEVRLDSDNRSAAHDDDDLLIHHGDVLINGTGVGTIGRAAAYLHADPAIPDNHVTILRPKAGLDSVFLSVFLNSMAGQWQVEQRLRGSSGQIEIYPTDITQFKVWIAPTEIQADIRRGVEASFAAKQHATQLLEAAKRAVEIAIEDSEAAALRYLEAFDER